MDLKLVSLTTGFNGMKAEELIAYTARVSNPSNQINSETAPKLLKYLIKHKHWSPFEMVSVCIEIKTSRGIAAQILRHRSFSFQEFSQRYAEAQKVSIYPARRQDQKNKQNSIDDMAENDKDWFNRIQKENWEKSVADYKEGLSRGIAKEQMRFILPLGTETTLYMSGTLRSWLHYIDVRADASTQKEHRDIALGIRDILAKEFPSVAEALGWSNVPV